MKTQIYFFFLSLLVLCFFNVKATNHIVVVSGNYPNYLFTPNSFNVNVGDSITWEQDFQTHPLTSTDIPGSAAPFNYSGFGNTFTYVITAPGLYSFKSATYNFSGQFMAQEETGIRQNNTPVATVSIYPNVTSDVVNLNVKETFSTAIKLNVEVYNALGNEVLNYVIVSDNPTQLHVGNLPAGLYFVSVRENSSVLSVQKIVKQ